jgi:hypothetical protein
MSEPSCWIVQAFQCQDLTKFLGQNSDLRDRIISSSRLRRSLEFKFAEKIEATSLKARLKLLGIRAHVFRRF